MKTTATQLQLLVTYLSLILLDHVISFHEVRVKIYVGNQVFNNWKPSKIIFLNNVKIKILMSASQTQG